MNDEIEYLFYTDDEGYDIYNGPDSDHPLFDQSKFMAALTASCDDKASAIGKLNPDNCWVDIGGKGACTYWVENPHYEGEMELSPEHVKVDHGQFNEI